MTNQNIVKTNKLAHAHRERERGVEESESGNHVWMVILLLLFFMLTVDCCESHPGCSIIVLNKDCGVKKKKKKMTIRRKTRNKKGEDFFKIIK